MNKIKKVCVIGLGYIGLPTAALLANRGYDIHGVDLDQRAVDIINRGRDIKSLTHVASSLADGKGLGNCACSRCNYRGEVHTC